MKCPPEGRSRIYRDASRKLILLNAARKLIACSSVPSTTVYQTYEVVRVLEEEQHSKIRNKTDDEEQIFSAPCDRSVNRIPTPVIYKCAKYEDPEVQPPGLVVKEQAEGQEIHIPDPKVLMQKGEYSETNCEDEQEQVLTEDQRSVLGINEYFSPAQQSTFNWSVLTFGSNMLLILGFCDFFYRFGRFISGKIAFINAS